MVILRIILQQNSYHKNIIQTHFYSKVHFYHLYDFYNKFVFWEILIILYFNIFTFCIETLVSKYIYEYYSIISPDSKPFYKNAFFFYNFYN